MKKQLYYLGERKKVGKVQPVYFSDGTKRIFCARVGRLQSDTIIECCHSYESSVVEFAKLAKERPSQFRYEVGNNDKEGMWRRFLNDQFRGIKSDVYSNWNEKNPCDYNEVLNDL